MFFSMEIHVMFESLDGEVQAKFQTDIWPSNWTTNFLFHSQFICLQCCQIACI